MSTENLNNTQAIEKLQQLIDAIEVGILSTFVDHTVYPHSVPMTYQEVDNQGNIWFLFSSESESYNHLMRNNKVSLTFGSPSTYEFLSINGLGESVHDDVKIEKYWNKFAEAWFTDKNAPRIRLLKVVPLEAHYWDNKSNKFMTLLKVAASAITGQKSDIAREGDINI